MKIGLQSVDWICLAKDKELRRALVRAVKKTFRFH